MVSGRRLMRASLDIPETAAEMKTVLARQLDPNRQELAVRDIMSTQIITASPEDSVLAAAKRMSENNISCVVVTDDEMVIGILTDKDILKGIAGHDTEFHRLTIGQRMSSPVELTSPEQSVVTTGQVMEAKGIKRLPVVDGGAIVGVVTQTDIMRGLISISPLGAVSDIMSTHIADVDTGATIAEAAQIMASKGISCLVAMHHGEVTGILTEKDLLRRVVALHKDPATTQVVDIMSFPIVSVPPNYSVLSAGKKMETMRLHRLLVMDNMRKVCGIITQTDIMRAVRRELEHLGDRHPSFDTEVRSLIDRLIMDTGKLRDILLTADETPCETYAR